VDEEWDDDEYDKDSLVGEEEPTIPCPYCLRQIHEDSPHCPYCEKYISEEDRFPALPDDDFDAAVHIAQTEFDRHYPDVVVGSSRGGAVAMNINSSDCPLVLLCPAWKHWGAAKTVKTNTIILHSKADETIPIAVTSVLQTSAGRMVFGKAERVG